MLALRKKDDWTMTDEERKQHEADVAIGRMIAKNVIIGLVTTITVSVVSELAAKKIVSYIENR